MRQIDHYIVYLKHDVISRQYDADKVSHEECWNRLAAQVTKDATQPIPRDVLQGHYKGRTVTVTPDTMDNLEIGKKIAQVTKLFLRLGSPDQRLSIAATGGLNALVANYARMVMPPSEGRTREENAINTAIGGAARCGDAGTVAYLIAKSLDLPVDLVRDAWRGATAPTTGPNIPVTPITQEQLRQATIDKVHEVLNELRSLQPAVADMENPGAPVYARQRALVKMISDRIEHLPDNMLSIVLRDLGRELPALGEAAREDAVDLLKVWMISVPDDMSSIEGIISGSNSRLISGVTSAQISGKASPQGTSSVASNEDDIGHSAGSSANSRGERNAEEGGQLFDILKRLRAGETDNLDARLQSLRKGMNSLRGATESKQDAALNALVNCWTVQYGKTEIRNVLQPLVEAHVPSSDLIVFLTEAIPGIAERAVRDKAIGDVHRYLEDIESNDELDEAAVSVGHCIEALHQRDKFGFQQWVALLHPVEPYLGQLSRDAYLAISGSVERVAKAERSAYGDSRMWNEYTRVFLEHNDAHKSDRTREAV